MFEIETASMAKGLTPRFLGLCTVSTPPDSETVMAVFWACSAMSCCPQCYSDVATLSVTEIFGDNKHSKSSKDSMVRHTRTEAVWLENRGILLFEDSSKEMNRNSSLRSIHIDYDYDEHCE